MRPWPGTSPWAQSACGGWRDVVHTAIPPAALEGEPDGSNTEAAPSEIVDGDITIGSERSSLEAISQKSGNSIAVSAIAWVALRQSFCRFSRSSTGCFSRMFVMGRTQFSGLGDTLIGEGAVA
jgi:hypothetical protein